MSAKKSNFVILEDTVDIGGVICGRDGQGRSGKSWGLWHSGDGKGSEKYNTLACGLGSDQQVYHLRDGQEGNGEARGYFCC